MSTHFVYLASGSPRRRELLQQIGVRFRILAVEVDEAVRSGEEAEVYVRRLAAAKAERGWQALVVETGGAPPAPVLGADTVVVLDGRIIGKPRDRSDALAILADLSGRTHAVLTAVSVCTATGTFDRLSRSSVRFRVVDEEECAAYWDTGEAADKAGAYAVQGYAAVFIADLAGSYSGVMGLPLFETAELLGLAGVARWSGP